MVDLIGMRDGIERSSALGSVYLTCIQTRFRWAQTSTAKTFAIASLRVNLRVQTKTETKRPVGVSVLGFR